MSAEQPTPYEMLGGAEGVRALAHRFYAIMAKHPGATRIRAMHAADLSVVADKLAGFLSGWTGGPRDYFENPEAPCIISLHKGYPIGAEERDEWLQTMSLAIQECGLTEEARAVIEPAFARIADAMRSR